MKLYYSVRQLPEIKKLSRQERIAVLLYFRQVQTQSIYRFRYAEIGFVASLVLAEIAGFIGGAIYWRGFWGSLAGGVLAMWSVMAVYFLADANITIPKLKRYLQSEGGRRMVERMKKLVAEANKPQKDSSKIDEDSNKSDEGL